MLRERTLYEENTFDVSDGVYLYVYLYVSLYVPLYVSLYVSLYVGAHAGGGAGGGASALVPDCQRGLAGSL